MADFSLSIRTNAAAGSQAWVADGTQLPRALQTWEREERLQGGYWQGYFEIHDLPLQQLVDGIYYPWLGHEVREQVGGRVTWEGMIYGMALQIPGGMIARFRSFDNMSNAVRVGYGNMIENGGFETAGAAPPVFASWSQNIAGGDAIAAETTTPAKDTKSAKLTNGGGGGTYVYQDVTVEAKAEYRISFLCAGDGTVAGRYRIYDVTNTADIVATTAADNTTTAYKSVSETITTPAGCTSLRVYLYAPSASGDAYFDSVRVERQRDGDNGQSYTAWTTQADSIARYGRKEAQIDGGDIGPTAAGYMAAQHLARYARPKTMHEPTISDTPAPPYLQVFCQGYIHTCNWLHTAEGLSGSGIAASTLIGSLADECEYVAERVIRTNGTLVRLPEQEVRAWDAMKRVTGASDSSGNLWRVYMQAGRVLVYEQVDFAPAYAMKGGRLYHRLGDTQAASVRDIRPGVVRDWDLNAFGTEPGTHFDQTRDFLMEGITVTAGGALRPSIAGMTNEG